MLKIIIRETIDKMFFGDRGWRKHNVARRSGKHKNKISFNIHD